MALPSISSLLRGIVDLHVHSTPDILLRRADDLALARECRAAGARAIVLKSHHVPTADRAWWARRVVPGVTVFGSLVLNDSVGGINPAAVLAALQLGARIIWLPTLSSARHRAFNGKRGGLVVARNGQVTRNTSAVLELVAAHDAALATGHVSPMEIRTVLQAATRAGVRRLIVTHPEHRVINLSFDHQRRLLDLAPVYFERCAWQPRPDGGYESNGAINLSAIRTLGAKSTVLASDAGEHSLPSWRLLFGHHLQSLARHGITSAQLDRMTRTNPGFLIGLCPTPPD